MKISICGCGWLGQPLAQHLKHSGHSIVATRRSEKGLQALDELGYKGIIYNLGEPLNSSAVQPLFSCDLLILNIPPGRKSINPESFVMQMKDLVAQANSCGIKNIIFISTTSVYGKQTVQVTEQTNVQPNTDSGLAHILIEQSVFEYFEKRGTVIRLAGLVGSGRHPAKFLAGRVDLKNGEQGVNLIHQQDVIRAIAQIIEKKIWGVTLHLAANEHPSREEYYRWAAVKLALPEPQFAPSGPLTGKFIDASWTLQKLGLKLLYPSPFDMLD
ncbi:MAG: nucleoside-diphosphate-sugar epimerase [Paraglaciecola sp.]|jgi:nucleoside-diphosphate-sugar epimerase